MTLVSSLSHVRTFTHLIAKTYQQTITDEERQARDALNLSIRADFGLLNQKLKETGVEVNWSMWSMSDYAYMVQKTRAMQQALITTYSSLMVRVRLSERQNSEAYVGLDAGCRGGRLTSQVRCSS